jgi:hypothetical protein
MDAWLNESEAINLKPEALAVAQIFGKDTAVSAEMIEDAWRWGCNEGIC